MKGLSIEIPEDVIIHLRLPPRNLEQELKKELAVHLYAEGLLPQASACRLAGMSRLALRAFREQQYDEAIQQFRTFQLKYPTSDLTDDAQ